MEIVFRRNGLKIQSTKASSEGRCRVGQSQSRFAISGPFLHCRRTNERVRENRLVFRKSKFKWRGREKSFFFRSDDVTAWRRLVCFKSDIHWIIPSFTTLIYSLVGPLKRYPVGPLYIITAKIAFTFMRYIYCSQVWLPVKSARDEIGNQHFFLLYIYLQVDRGLSTAPRFAQ